jgi:hypothetical protein
MRRKKTNFASRRSYIVERTLYWRDLKEHVLALFEKGVSQSESIECLMDDQAFLPSYDLAPRPPPPPSRQEVVSLSHFFMCAADRAY